MFFLLSGAVLVFLQFLLIITSKINIFPEIYLFSYLTSRGLIPYRDFFDHHGFLLSYLNAPLMFDKSFVLLKFAYIVIQSVNLILFLIIIKKNTNKVTFLTGGFFFILISFFFSENNYWYETAILPFYLLIYIILTDRKIKFSSFYCGILTALSSFVKPIALIVILPVMISSKSTKPLIYFILTWIPVLIYFYEYHGIKQLISNLFTFNSFLTSHYPLPIGFNFKAVFLFLVLFTVSSYIAIKRNYIKKYYLLYFFILVSLIFLRTGIEQIHLFPAVIFMTILIVLTLKLNQYAAYRILFIFVFLFLLRKDIQLYSDMHHKIPWQEDPRSRRIVQKLEDDGLSQQNLYVFSNHTEEYLYLNKIPPTYYPIRFPMIENYDKNYENKIIADLVNNKTKIIAVPVPQEKEFANLTLLKNYINRNFVLNETSESYLIYLLE